MKYNLFFVLKFSKLSTPENNRIFLFVEDNEVFFLKLEEYQIDFHLPDIELNEKADRVSISWK